VLGCVLVGDVEAERWRVWARARLEDEVRHQVLPDGSSFEASTAYHGLALELLLVAYTAASSVGLAFSSGFEERLRRMLDLSAALRRPDGTVGQIGDSDSGRVLPGGFERIHSHDALLALGAALLSLPLPYAGPPDPELAWSLGLSAWERVDGGPRAAEVPRSAAFEDGGWYVLRNASLQVVVRCGDVGQGGNGGHAHNDALSYELAAGVPIVVDPGTYSYTADVSARNVFRGSRVHNVVMVDGEELNPFSPTDVFRLPQTAHIVVSEWRPDERGGRLRAAHDGYQRLEPPVLHTRELELERATFRVLDTLTGSGRQALSSRVQLAPGVDVRPIGDGLWRLSADGAVLDLRVATNLAVRLEDAAVSPEYGVAVAAPAIVAEGTVELPDTTAWTFTRAA
jgi:uncharacterized heparinase superfamily protein